MRYRTSTAGFIVGLLSLLSAFGAAAQEAVADNMQILRDKLEADKKLLVASNLTLTQSQAAAFWPIYDEYQGELDTINRRVAGLIRDYAQAYNSGSVSDATAGELLDEMIAIEEAEVALKRTYADRLSDALPAAVTARYLQIENKIRAIVKFDLAASIPLVE